MLKRHYCRTICTLCEGHTVSRIPVLCLLTFEVDPNSSRPNSANCSFERDLDFNCKFNCRITIVVIHFDHMYVSIDELHTTLFLHQCAWISRLAVMIREFCQSKNTVWALILVFVSISRFFFYIFFYFQRIVLHVWNRLLFYLSLVSLDMASF